MTHYRFVEELTFNCINHELLIPKLNTYGFDSLSLKGYLRCKMITPQNVLSDAQVKKFFIL